MSDDKTAFQGISDISKMILKPKIDYRLAKNEVYINEIGSKTFLPFHLCQNLLAVVNLTLQSNFEVVGVGATISHFYFRSNQVGL
jgi:hypothetical protein